MRFQNSKQLVKTLYKNDYGKPFELTDGQEKIFDLIWKRQNPRNQIITYTQYGKTETVSMALLSRVSTWAEKWAITAPDDKRAKILVGDMIKHIFENDYTRKRFQIGKLESEERIRRERSKSRLTFRNDGGIGEVFIVSAQAKFKGEDAGNALMGFGAPNLIEDESSLIPDRIHAKAMRMVGGHTKNFVLKIGNPFTRGHFLRTWNSKDYHKILIDYHQGIKEGRITPEFIEEMKKETDFDILYECKFPAEDMIDEKGWMRLFFDEDIKKALVEPGWTPRGEPRLGVDIGRGKNYSTFILRYSNFAVILEKNQSADLMTQVVKIEHYKKQYTIKDENIFVDDVGVGGGVVDRLAEKDIMVNGVKEGGKAIDERYYNIKAEGYFLTKEWLKEGGRLVEDDDWFELYEIKYKRDTSDKLKIEPKEQLFMRGKQSPDVADGLMLTFPGSQIMEKEDFEII